MTFPPTKKPRAYIQSNHQRFTQSLPRVDALTSRLFLLSLIPELSTVPSALRPLASASAAAAAAPRHPRTRTRALDVGAGIGRITATVLLHLLDDVVLLEPATHFVREALHRVQGAAHAGVAETGEWKGVSAVNTNVNVNATKSVTVVQGTLQAFDPRLAPGTDGNGLLLGRVGYTPSAPTAGSATDSEEVGYDVIWCQWCLGHLSDTDLVSFFQRARAALRNRSSNTNSTKVNSSSSVIVVKENTCREDVPGEPRVVFDETDSSLTRYVPDSVTFSQFIHPYITFFIVLMEPDLSFCFPILDQSTNHSSVRRSDAAWKKTFADAGLTLIKEEQQQGFPEGLYPVKMYVFILTGKSQHTHITDNLRSTICWFLISFLQVCFALRLARIMYMYRAYGRTQPLGEEGGRRIASVVRGLHSFCLLFSPYLGLFLHWFIKYGYGDRVSYMY